MSIVFTLKMIFLKPVGAISQLKKNMSNWNSKLPHFSLTDAAISKPCPGFITHTGEVLHQVLFGLTEMTLLSFIIVI